jgi:plastocyanin
MMKQLKIKGAFMRFSIITKVNTIMTIGFAAYVSASPAAAVIHDIDIGNFFFSPLKTVVNQGDTVRWTLLEGVHTTTSDPSSPKQWDSGIMELNSSFDIVIAPEDGSGPFPYHCEVHSLTMIDTIFVASSTCDCEPGNSNGDETLNIFDITYTISFLYLDGPEPTPYTTCSADPNMDCTINIFDITYIISSLYLGGPQPASCEDWVSSCGSPLSK